MTEYDDNKITQLMEFMRLHSRQLQIEENETLEQLDEEQTILMHQVIGEKIDVLLGLGDGDKAKTAREWKITPAAFFDLEVLKDLVRKDHRVANEKSLLDHLPRLLTTYGKGSQERKYLITIGDPKLGLYSTAQRLGYELRTLKYINHRFPNASVKASEEAVHAELSQGKYRTMSEEQAEGVRSCVLTDSMISGLQGYAGAGKSFTMGAVANIYRGMGYEVMGVTLSSMAAQVLSNESKMNCTTVDDMLNILSKRGDKPFNKPTVIIIDEAGLVGMDKFHKLLSYVVKSNVPVKIILSGDSTQLNPINDANSLELAVKVIEDRANAVIAQIRRQRSPSHIKAVHYFRQGEAGRGLYTFLQQESIHIADDRDSLIQKVCQDHFDDMISDPTRTSLVLCQDNDLVDAFNIKIQDLMKAFGRVSEETTPILVAKKNGGTKMVNMGVGDQVRFTNNFKKVPLIRQDNGEPFKGMYAMNQMRGTLKQVTGDKYNGFDLIVEIPMDDDNSPDGKVMCEVRVNTKHDIKLGGSDGCGLDLNYAITTYSSQGQTVDMVYVVDSDRFDCRNAYVAMSRHRADVKVYADKKSIMNRIFKRQNQNKKDDEHAEIKYLNTLDVLNEVGNIWSRNVLQPSLIVKSLNTYAELKTLAARNRVSFDMNNISDSFFQLKREHDYEERERIAHKGRIQEWEKDDDMKTILDSVEYFVYNPPSIDYRLLSRDIRLRGRIREAFSKQVEETGQSNINTDYLPIKKKEKYHLHEMIDKTFFNEHDGRLVSIGRGSEIRFLAGTEAGTILSKYDMYGFDGMGVGYPMMAHGGASTKHSEILIIEDLNLYLDYLRRYYLEADESKAEQKPVIIWGAKTTDYSHIVNSFENKEIRMIGSHFFKYNTFFRITHAFNGLQLNANFVNIDQNTIEKLYLPTLDEEAETELYHQALHKMPVNHKKFGTHANPKALANVTYGTQKNQWETLINNVIDAHDDESIILKNEMYIPKEVNSLVDEHGVFPVDFILNYIVENKLFYDESKPHEEAMTKEQERIQKELLPRMNRIFKFKQAIKESDIRLDLIDESVEPKLGSNIEMVADNTVRYSNALVI